jgi:hypothetical protein
MRLFLSASPEDTNYLPTFASLVKGSHATAVKFKTDAPSMFAEFVNWCKLYEADAVVITNIITLEFVLHAQPDFRPPNTKKGITLNDYQGSLLSVRVGDRTIPAVVLNPLEHLVTVSYGKFLAERFLSKILYPERWMPDIPFVWREVKDVEDAELVTLRLAEARIIAADIETPTQGEWAELRGINCCGYAGLYLARDGTPSIECYVFPFEDWSYQFLKRVNDNPVPKVTQNGLYDNLYFLRWGLPCRMWLWDTYHLFHSWLSELPKDLALISAFNVRKVRYWKDDGKTGDRLDYYRYNAQDCWATLCALLGIMRDAPDWAIRNYTEHEFPVVFPAITCEIEGIRVDEERFHEVFKKKLEEKHHELIEIQTMLGGPCDELPIKKKKVTKDGVTRMVDDIQNFNPNSPKQVLKVFEMFGLKFLGSTDKAAVLKARAAHPLIDRVVGAIADWKSNAKVISGYLQEYKLWKIGEGPTQHTRLFYKLDPAGTDTGRLASKASSFWCGFQIQNIPRDDSVKQCLIADPGWELGEGDYAQSEARCVGYMSGETKLIEVVEGPHDYHAWNASAFFGVPYECIYDDSLHKTVNKALRDLSKRTNHGANYNMGDGVMLDTMGPKYVAEAKRLLKLPPALPLKKVCAYLLSVYEKTYPRVKQDWYGSIVKTIRVSGMLVSPLGWTRKFFGKPWENKRDLNASVAHGPQNLSVGIINKTFVRIWRDQIYGDLRGLIRIKAQIHDSILFQFRAGQRHLADTVRERMINPVEVTDCFGITRTMVIPPDMSAGKVRWSELK